MIGGFFVSGICVVCSGVIASRLTPTGERIPNVGVSLLAMNDTAVSSLWINPIQRPVHRQLGQHDDLLDRQCRMTLGPAKLIGKVTR